MSKKTILVTIIIAALLVLGIGIYLLFFTSPLIQTPTNNTNYSPFGNYGGSSSTTPPVTTTVSSTTEDTAIYINSSASPLIKISTTPIAGAEAFDVKNPAIKNASSTSIVRYTDRATGHTMEYNRTTSMLGQTSNTTIPSIYRAFWSGNTVLAQFLGQGKDVIKTYSGNIPATTTPGSQISGTFLTDGIYNLAISPKGNRVFYIQSGDNAVGTISNLNGSKPTQILSFPFNEWAVQWPNENTITLTTKASASASGYMYFLSSTGSTMTKALGDVVGLTTNTSPALLYTIYSGSSNNGIATGIYDFKKGVTLALNKPTLAEKCVWSTLNKTTAYCAVPTSVPSGSYPDDWYQGKISFVDNIYKVDMSLSTMQLLYNLPADQNIDATNLFLDPKEENLYFTNKNDYYLWGLTIKGLFTKSQ